MHSNQPEAQFFKDIVEREVAKADCIIDIKQLYGDAKEADVDVKVLRKAVKLHLEDAKKRKARTSLESAAEDLLHRLGHLGGTPLGEAAVRAVGEYR